jgi:hypothetical protein
MSPHLIHCKTRPFPNASPPVPAEEIWLGIGFLRADPEQDAAGGYIRVTPTDAARPSFAVIPFTGATDPLSVYYWWLGCTTAIGSTSGALG